MSELITDHGSIRNVCDRADTNFLVSRNDRHYLLARHTATQRTIAIFKSRGLQLQNGSMERAAFMDTNVRLIQRDDRQSWVFTRAQKVWTDDKAL